MINPILDLEQRILFEQDDIVVVNKPYDIPTSGRSLDDDDALQYWLMKRHEGMVWAIHQLDADTTGINLFTTRKKLVGKLQNALSDIRTSKRYLAIVHGVPQWNEFECTEPVGKVDSKSLGVTQEGKSAHSLFRVIESVGDYSIIEAQIFTGRTHQIRIHLSHLGYPLVGEEWYCNPPCTEHPRQALHSYHLDCTETLGLSWAAPLAEDFSSLLEHLGFEYK